MKLLAKFLAVGVVLALIAIVVFGQEDGDVYWTSTYAGMPRSYKLGDELVVLLNDGFIVGYSNARMDPLWVCYRLFRVVNPSAGERPRKFKVDMRTLAQVSHDDYTNSGYDRGHMAPNYAIATRYGREAQLQTFLMSNVCPQTPGLNRGLWKHLEKEAREYANDLDEIWVITGPIFDADIERLPSNVEIPDKFYKILVDEFGGSLRMLAFIMPQDVPSSSTLDDFLVSVDKIEKLTGLDFLWPLDDELEAKLEAYTETVLW